ncbi:MAG: hypothetical protein GY943_37405, partial [Chloroflexi bacterium]|nr:hypothetical protein [Chloroflexota bacterium]
MKTYWYLALPFLGTLFCLLLLWDGTAAIAADTTTNETAVCSSDIKILTVGDSITLGDGSENGHGYRQLLYVNLRNAGIDVDFVGPYADPISDTIDLDHGSSAGKGGNFFSPKIETWLTNNEPDIVLLHVGSNDITTNYTQTGRIEPILNNIDQYESDENTAVPVILAQIINRACLETNTNCQIRSNQTDDLNANLAAMMLARTDYNNNLTMINMEDDANLIYTLAPTGDFYDDMHPVDSGYQKMADEWQNSISGLLPSPCNLSPVVVSTAATDADVNHDYGYTVIGSGYPEPTYALDTAPAGMNINTTSGEISWTPTEVQAGIHTIIVDVTNTEGTVSHSFTIDVGEPPVFSSSPDTETIVSQPYSYQITANGTNPISFTLNTAPTGMTIVSNTGLISWTPTVTQTGQHDIDIQANNVDGSAVQTYTLSVWAMPEITTSPVSDAVANVPYSYDIDADGFPAPTFALVNPPTGMTVTLDSGVVSWTPAPANAGSHTITVTASNDAGSDSQTYTLTVNSLPLITSTPITATTPGVAYAYEVTAVGTQPITYTLVKGAGDMVLNDITGQLTWTPTIDDVGTYNIKIKAMNAYGQQIQTFALTVTSEPIITSTPDTVTDAEKVYNYTVKAAGSPPISYTLPIHPEGMSINASGVITWTPTLADVGNHTVWVRVTNDYGFDTQPFNVLVMGAPEINSTPVVLAVAGNPYSYTLDVVGIKPLNYTLTESPAGMRINRRNGLITWTPAIDQAGFHTVTFEVTNELGIDTQTYILKVRRAPTF